MRGRLPNVLSVLSLLLCLAICVLWVRSYRGRDGIAYEGPAACWALWSARGDVGFWGAWGEGLRDVSSGDGRAGWSLSTSKPDWMAWLDYSHWDPRVSGAGFFIGMGRSTPHVKLDRRVVIEVPSWFVLVLTAILPADRLTARVVRLAGARRAKRAGLCPHCGYDLRASPGRCPACGAKP